MKLSLTIIATFVILMPLFWCAVCVLLSRSGGWMRLAETYSDDRQPQGEAHRWKSAKIGWVSYNNVLTLHFSPVGLHLSMPIMFRIGHPSLLIPWDDFHQVEEKRLYGFVRCLSTQVGAAESVSMIFPKKLIPTFSEYLK